MRYLPTISRLVLTRSRMTIFQVHKSIVKISWNRFACDTRNSRSRVVNSKNDFIAVNFFYTEKFSILKRGDYCPSKNVIVRNVFMTLHFFLTFENHM